MQPRADLPGVSADPEPAADSAHASPASSPLLCLLWLLLLPGPALCAAVRSPAPPQPPPPPPLPLQLRVAAPPPPAAPSCPCRQSRQRRGRGQGQSQTGQHQTAAAATANAPPEDADTAIDRLTRGARLSGGTQCGRHRRGRGLNWTGPQQTDDVGAVNLSDYFAGSFIETPPLQLRGPPRGGKWLKLPSGNHRGRRSQGDRWRLYRGTRTHTVSLQDVAPPADLRSASALIANVTVRDRVKVCKGLYENDSSVSISVHFI